MFCLFKTRTRKWTRASLGGLGVGVGWALVQFRTGPMTDGIKRCWCMHSTKSTVMMVCATVTVCFSVSHRPGAILH